MLMKTSIAIRVGSSRVWLGGLQWWWLSTGTTPCSDPAPRHPPPHTRRLPNGETPCSIAFRENSAASCILFGPSRFVTNPRNRVVIINNCKPITTLLPCIPALSHSTELRLNISVHKAVTRTKTIHDHQITYLGHRHYGLPTQLRASSVK